MYNVYIVGSIKICQTFLEVLVNSLKGGYNGITLTHSTSPQSLHLEVLRGSVRQTYFFVPPVSKVKLTYDHVGDLI